MNLKFKFVWDQSGGQAGWQLNEGEESAIEASITLANTFKSSAFPVLKGSFTYGSKLSLDAFYNTKVKNLKLPVSSYMFYLICISLTQTHVSFCEHDYITV